ncbi:endonuclease/exonuclease/phosphatase family protein [Aromatoleum anaerobium]|uniref:Endonuclease n=1 Tax=Aromatoleum anaerobium TaxID=182180 RepID=A0ABX1PH19_9RHOO|nr:endonuclease/exonuclease/phosphatase family protein [Aromatoleum anaerobium]MCK0508873.1 endonuclease/exonuclease/phosphatase family protein [Aromatoleum anaerobium]
MRIVSWNIQWGRGADGRVDLARTVAAIHDIGDADVICLQEVAQNFPGLEGGNREDEVGILAAAFPGHEAIYGAGVDVPDGAGGRARFGNLMLSRLAVGPVFRHLLPCPADPEQPAIQRCCVEAVLQAPWGSVRVLTTHLEYYSARQRAAQVAMLRALQKEVAGHARDGPGGREASPAFAARRGPVTAVVCGDFNCEPGSGAYTLMSADIALHVPPWRDAWRVKHGSRVHDPTVGLHGAEWPGRAYCCDYAWVSDDLAARVAKVEVYTATPASDHQPLVLELND